MRRVCNPGANGYGSGWLVANCPLSMVNGGIGGSDMRGTWMMVVLASLLVGSTARAEGGRKLLVADESKRRIAIVDAGGKIEWEYKIGSLHDLQLLPNGNVLFHGG